MDELSDKLRIFHFSTFNVFLFAQKSAPIHIVPNLYVLGGMCLGDFGETK